MNVFEWLKVLLIGIVEGITEWLPISSTGHMILVETFLPFKAADVFTEEFLSMFNVVIQLGAILAVVRLFFRKLNPWDPAKDKDAREETWVLWLKILIGCVPAGIIGVLLDDWLDAHLYNAWVIGIMLIVYGVGFLLVERRNATRKARIRSLEKLDIPTVIGIGLFQVLALIPGTSRSGATILGGLLLGCSRAVAAEYTFFLAVPVMFGASALKMVKYGFAFSGTQIGVLLIAMVVAYVVSVLAIRFLMGYIKKHDFTVFGWYRIALGLVVMLALWLAA